MAGQINKRGDNSWTVRIFLGRDARGKRKYFNKTIWGTKKEVQMYLTAKLREKDLGSFVEPAALPLNEYLERWLNEVAEMRLREATFEGYKWIVKAYIGDTLGYKRLSDVQAYEVQGLYNDMLKRGLSARTVRYTHSVLSSALAQAVKWKMISQNPCDSCELPKMEKTEMKCFSPAETVTFLENAKKDKYFTLFLLAIETGLRPEEYLGLQWKDVDLEERTLSVRRAVKLRKGGGYYFTEPKTKKSRRSIPLSVSVVNSLRTHRIAQLEARMTLGPAYQNLDLVFATDIGTPLLIGNLRRRHFDRIVKEANLPKIRLYDLRHTTATLLLSAGENPKVVSERLGHASIVLTLDTYSHVLPTMQRTATEKIEKMMLGT